MESSGSAIEFAVPAPRRGGRRPLRPLLLALLGGLILLGIFSGPRIWRSVAYRRLWETPLPVDFTAGRSGFTGTYYRSRLTEKLCFRVFDPDGDFVFQVPLGQLFAAEVSDTGDGIVFTDGADGSVLGRSD